MTIKEIMSSESTTYREYKENLMLVASKLGIIKLYRQYARKLITVDEYLGKAITVIGKCDELGYAQKADLMKFVEKLDNAPIIDIHLLMLSDGYYHKGQKFCGIGACNAFLMDEGYTGYVKYVVTKEKYNLYYLYSDTIVVCKENI